MPQTPSLQHLWQPKNKYSFLQKRLYLFLSLLYNRTRSKVSYAILLDNVNKLYASTSFLTVMVSRLTLCQVYAWQRELVCYI